MTLKAFLDLYDDWNGYTQINDVNCEPYARVKTDRIENGNYNHLLDCEVLSFGFYETKYENGTSDWDLCVRINYSMSETFKEIKKIIESIP